MSDLSKTFSKSMKKRLEVQSGEKVYTEQELAQATADALEAAAQVAEDEWKLDEHNEGHPEFSAKYGTVEVADAIRALAADITAKAKERLSRHCCDICGQDLSGQDFDGHYTIVCHKPTCADHLFASAEHDAKIRREAYLRCAELYRTELDPRRFDISRPLEVMKMWANEADGREK